MGKKKKEISFNLFDVEEDYLSGEPTSHHEEPIQGENKFSFFEDNENGMVAKTFSDDINSDENNDFDRVSVPETFEENGLSEEEVPEEINSDVEEAPKEDNKDEFDKNNINNDVVFEEVVFEETPVENNTQKAEVIEYDLSNSTNNGDYEENLFEIAKKKSAEADGSSENSSTSEIEEKTIDIEYENIENGSIQESNNDIERDFIIENAENKSESDIQEKEIVIEYENQLNQSSNNNITKNNENSFVIEYDNQSENEIKEESNIENQEEIAENEKAEEIIESKEDYLSEVAEESIIPEFNLEEELPETPAKKKGFFLFKRNKKKNSEEDMDASAFEISSVSEAAEDLSADNLDEKDLDTDVSDNEDADTENSVFDNSNAENSDTENSVFNTSIAEDSDIEKADEEEYNLVRKEEVIDKAEESGNDDSTAFEVSTLAETPDTDKMVSILEDDVSSEVSAEEIGVQDEIDFSSFKAENVEKIEKSSHEEYKKFEEIKNISVMDKFETPYVYIGKNGEHIRHRLSLPTDKDPKKLRKKRDIMGYIITFVVALIVALFLRSFVFVFATVDGPSMEPTLYTNERILVTRYTYYFSEIERGDIIVCDFPSEFYTDHYVKRVIALGGETVKIQNGIVYVNDKAMTEEYIKEQPTTDMDPVYVPEGYVFVMGDNRNNSTDSRKSYIGPISKKLVIGKARTILFPFSKIGSLE